MRALSGFAGQSTELVASRTNPSSRRRSSSSALPVAGIAWQARRAARLIGAGSLSSPTAASHRVGAAVPAVSEGHEAPFLVAPSPIRPGRLRERGDSPTIQDAGQASAECLIAPSGRPTRSRRSTGLWLFSAPCSRVLTTRAGGSRVVESLVVRKEPPSSTVRSRSLRVLADGRTTASSVCGSRRSTRRPTGRPTSSRSPPARSRDAGLTTQREYEITSSSRGADPLGRALHDLVSVRTGGYDLEPDSAGGTRLRDVQRARGPRPGEGFRRPSRCDRRKGAGDFVGAVKRAVEAARLDS